MATYYAIPCPQELRENFSLLIHNFENNSSQPQNQLLIKVANDYTDKIIEVKATAHTLIKQVLHKMKNEEMSSLAGQIRARKLMLGQNEYISFPVTSPLAAAYRQCYEQIKQGDIQAREPLMRAMLEFSQLANHYFYHESLKPLKLGFVTRKIADLGGVTINKASQAAITKLVPQLDIQELQAFVDYLEPFFIDVEV